MAGHIRKTSQGRYQARFPLGGRGRFRSRTFDRKIDAERWLTAQTARRDRGDWIDPRQAETQFSEVAEAWRVSRRSLAASTRARDESVMANLVLPHLGELELRHIGVETLDGWVRHLDEEAEKAPNTVRKAFQLASAVLDRAVTLKKIPANPARAGERIHLPRLDDREMRFLSPEEVDDLAEAIEDRYRPLVYTAAYTGLRFGELAGLRAPSKCAGR